ncbi:radical SAM/SPASM domain-containing protein [Algihabitans albus]|uniref:radical SAM/SPASM domain-containing protein n=1 Tax=Algihabitans albus TaxID=2164067 RepID=UPI0013C2ACD7|nr:radical SAM protein [Algihabitans albus]
MIQPLVFTLVAKVTQSCNLRCTYCYSSRPGSPIMTQEILTDLISASRQLEAAAINIVWHGGEPTLAGLPFYEKAIGLQTEISRQTGIVFTNAIQTNATLLTSAWAAFLAENHFDVGVSVDPDLRDMAVQRRFRHGSAATQAALQGIALLRQARVTPGVMCVLDPHSPPDARALLDWLHLHGLDSVSLNAEFSARIQPGRAWSLFLTDLRKEILQSTAREKIVIKELLLAATDPKQRSAMGLFDACHPGWPCTETIHAIGQDGSIYFGCDRFSGDATEQTRRFRLGHVSKGGFKSARQSAAFREHAQEVQRQRSYCAKSCSAFDSCDGGCVADWMLAPETVTKTRPDTAFCDGIAALREVCRDH